MFSPNQIANGSSRPSLLGQYDPNALRRQSLFSGMANAGIGLLSQPPSRFPIGIGESFGAGMQGFQTGMQQGRGDYFSFLDAERKNLEYKRQQDQRAAFEKMIPTLPADLQSAAKTDPDGFFKIWVEESAKTHFEAPEAPKRDQLRIGNEQVTQQWNPKTRAWDEVGRGPAFKQTPDTVVSMTGEKEYEKVRGKGFADIANEIDKDERAAFKTLNSLRAMEQQIARPDFYSGFGANQLMTLKRFGTSMGFDPKQVTGMESFNALSKQAALDTMGGSLGTGFSNADRDFVIDQVPNIGNTPEGNKAVIQINRALQTRKIEIARLARTYEKQHGQIDEGFHSELSQWAEANPLFADTSAAPGGARNSDPSSMTDEELMRALGR